MSRGIKSCVWIFLWMCCWFQLVSSKLLTDVQKDLAFIWSWISEVFFCSFKTMFKYCFFCLFVFLKELLSSCHLLQGRGSAVWEEKGSSIDFIFVSLLRSVGKSLCYFYPGNCIAFSITSGSDNSQKLVPTDQFCFLCSTPRFICQEPESVSFDFST